MEAAYNEFVSSVSSLDWLGKFLTGLAIVVITALCSHLASKLLRRALRSDSNPLPASSIIVNLVRAAIWVAGIGVLLKACFGVDPSGIIAGLGVVGIAVSLGMQDTISNLIAGLQVTLMKVVTPGDRVRVSGMAGRVRDVTWRNTVLVTQDGTTVIIPNSKINSGQLEIFGDKQQVSIDFSVPIAAYSDDLLARIKDAAAQGLGEHMTADPLVKVIGTDEYGTSMKGLIAVSSDWTSVDSTVRSQVMRQVAPILRQVQLDAGQDGGAGTE